LGGTGKAGGFGLGGLEGINVFEDGADVDGLLN